MFKTVRLLAGLALALGFGGAAEADQPWDLGNHTRVLALGDSLTAGYGATPMTNGYAYLLYRDGVYDTMTNTSFADAAVPGATSAQVLDFQVPLALQTGYQPEVIVMTVGGNDLLTILNGADPTTVINAFAANLTGILGQLCAGLPNSNIYVSNLYDIQNFPVSTTAAVLAFNQAVAAVVGGLDATPACGGRVKVADIYSAFLGSQQGLLLINRNGAGQFEVHPSNAGYRAMEQAFAAAK